MRTFLLATLSVGCLLAQAPSDLKFEVASIKPSPPSGYDRVTIGLHLDGAQVRIVALPMRDYIARAYRVNLFRVSGPDWITSDRFDLNAKLPAGANSDQIPEMLQALLAERFGMKAHREKKELPVYALTLGKPPLKVQESAPDEPGTVAPAKGVVNAAITGDANGVSVDLGNGSYYTFAAGKFTISKVTMEGLARQLERYLDRPLVDMTGLKGTYDLSVTVTPEDAQIMLIHAAAGAGVPLPPQALQFAAGASTPSLLDAFAQLGLKMDSRKAPLDVILVDQASKTPTEN